MKQPSGISRRIEQCIKHIQELDYEGALVNLYPALDKTAKKRHPRKGVGDRIRAFLEEEEILISAIAINNIVARISVNGISITDALYKFGRTSVMHEGELDPRLQFNNAGSLEITTEKWNLPSGYIIGMSMAVIVAPENQTEKLNTQLRFSLFGQQLLVNDIWGKREMVRSIICEKFNNHGLFKRT